MKDGKMLQIQFLCFGSVIPKRIRIMPKRVQIVPKRVRIVPKHVQIVPKRIRIPVLGCATPIAGSGRSWLGEAISDNSMPGFLKLLVC